MREISGRKILVIRGRNVITINRQVFRRFSGASNSMYQNFSGR